jgi:hypothetical protein
LKLQTRASQVFRSIVCTVQKPSYLKGRPSCCDNCISISIAKASSCPPVYFGWQLHVSYIPGLTVDPLHFVLHRKCKKLLTGIWLLAVCKYFLPELWPQNCLGEDSLNDKLVPFFIIPFLSLSLCSSTIEIWFMLRLQPYLLCSCSCFHPSQFSQPLSFSYFLLACVQPIFEQ